MANVTISNNGPIRIEGDFKLVDAAGAPWDLSGRVKIALCRCGQSANKPFCDGSHGKTGFQSQCVAATLPPPALKGSGASPSGPTPPKA
jgi:CDGSH-type Zn-finger protein